MSKVFQLGSFEAIGKTEELTDGSSYPALELRFDGRKGGYTTLDAYEALQLKNALENWLSNPALES